jgi:integrase
MGKRVEGRGRRRKGGAEMAIFRRGNTWWYKFYFAGRLVRESAKSTSKTVAKKAEKQRRRDLEEAYNNISDNREQRVQTVGQTAHEYLEDYKLRHRSATFAEYAIGHITRFVGNHMQIDVSDDTVKQYQSLRLKEGAAPKSINEEVGFLLRLLNERGDAIRYKMRRGKTLRLKVPPSIGKAYDATEKAALLRSADLGASQSPEGALHKLAGTRSPFIKPALSLAFNAGMRDGEIRNLTWEQVDLEKGIITVGRSKTEAGEGRTIPLNSELHSVFAEYVAWCTRRFGTANPEWYVFPGRPGKPEKGMPRPYDPTRAISTLKTSWSNVRARAGAKGRFHDTSITFH